MKRLMIASLVAAQTLAVAQPALAATIDDLPIAAQQSHGAFAGARLRVPLGGETRAIRAGLAVAPMQRSEASDGRAALRFSEGMELGFAGKGKARLMLAGQPIGARFGVAQDEDDDGGPSTLGTIAIVVGGLLVAGAIGVAVLAHEISKNSE